MFDNRNIPEANWLQKLENRLAEGEKGNIKDFTQNSTRWIFFKTLILPAVTLGLKIAGASEQVTIYALGGSLFIVGSSINSALKQKGVNGTQQALAVVFLLGALAVSIVLIVI